MRNAVSVLPLLLAIACTGDPVDEPVDPCLSPGTICTWAGVPETAAFADEGLHRLDSHLYLPVDIYFGADGTTYLPDYNNHRVRRIEADDTMTTISGTGMLGDGPIGSDGCYAPTPCDSRVSAWNHPTDLAVDPNDANFVYVAAWHNSRINRIDLAAGELEWVAGTGGRQYGGDEGPAAEAVLDLPSSLDFDERTGILYFSDAANHLVRRIDPDGVIHTVAGSPRTPGFQGDGGLAVDALLHGDTGQKADPGSKLEIVDGILYLVDSTNGVIRAIDLDTGIIDTIAGKYVSAGVDDAGVDKGSVGGYAGDGGDAMDAVFDSPRDVAIGIDGELYVADMANHCIRVIDAGSNVVETAAGTCGTPGFAGDEGPATEALLYQPYGVEVDADGNLYVVDSLNHVIRRVMR